MIFVFSFSSSSTRLGNPSSALRCKKFSWNRCRTLFAIIYVAHVVYTRNEIELFLKEHSNFYMSQCFLKLDLALYNDNDSQVEFDVCSFFQPSLKFEWNTQVYQLANGHACNFKVPYGRHYNPRFIKFLHFFKGLFS